MAMIIACLLVAEWFAATVSNYSSRIGGSQSVVRIRIVVAARGQSIALDHEQDHCSARRNRKIPFIGRTQFLFSYYKYT